MKLSFNDFQFMLSEGMELGIQVREKVYELTFTKSKYKFVGYLDTFSTDEKSKKILRAIMDEALSKLNEAIVNKK